MSNVYFHFLLTVITTLMGNMPVFEGKLLQPYIYDIIVDVFMSTQATKSLSDIALVIHCLHHVLFVMLHTSIFSWLKVQTDYFWLLPFSTLKSILQYLLWLNSDLFIYTSMHFLQ